MKRINKIFGLSLSLAAVFGLASCSNEVGEPANTPDNNTPSIDKLELVKTPDVVAYSGSTTYGGNTKGTWKDEESGKTYYIHDDEVEVNLSINEPHDKYDVADLVTKLSLHVRSANDVKVTLPLPTTYIVESDDLYIFNQHYANDADHQGAYGADKYGYELAEKLETKSSTVEYKIPLYSLDEEGHIIYQKEGDEYKLDANGAKIPEVAEGSPATVSLSIVFGAGTVTITTSGITADVYKNCKAYNQDGLNFEVYLYLQTGVKSINDNVFKENERKALKDILEGITTEDGVVSENHAKVEIISNLDKLPSYYINAFGYEPKDGDYTNGSIGYTGNVNPYDCVVTLQNSGYDRVGGQANKTYEHLNGTPFNVIYYLSSLTADKVDHAHGGKYVYDPNAKEEEGGND